MRLSAYVQDKLEFEGMIANVGLRMDYVQGQKWYAFRDYDASLGIGNAGMIDTSSNDYSQWSSTIESTTWCFFSYNRSV